LAVSFYCLYTHIWLLRKKHKHLVCKKPAALTIKLINSGLQNTKAQFVKLSYFPLLNIPHRNTKPTSISTIIH
jgi:hypothetical protein